MTSYLAEIASVMIFVAFGLAFAAFNIFLSKFIGPRKPDARKLSTYECGEIPVGSPWIQFNIRYYVIAIIFIIFEMEIVFLLPCAVIFSSFGSIALAFGEVLVFIIVLVLGLSYVWARGHLEWIRPKSLDEVAREQLRQRTAVSQPGS